MFITHNMMALNVYRNLLHNYHMMSKSLECLSSGLRINRAADDAAGFAISEKMRAQIRGLEKAEKMPLTQFPFSTRNAAVVTDDVNTKLSNFYVQIWGFFVF